MPEYIFDGKRLKKRSGQKEGEIDKNLVRAWNGAKLGEIEGKKKELFMHTFNLINENFQRIFSI